MSSFTNLIGQRLRPVADSALWLRETSMRLEQNGILRLRAAMAYAHRSFCPATGFSAESSLKKISKELLGPCRLILSFLRKGRA